MLKSSDSENTDDNDPCGKRNFRATADRLAMEFAVSEINEDENILPEILLGTNMKDTCSDLDHAVNKTLDYQFVKSRFVNTSQQCEPRATEAKCCLDSTENNATLVAIVAGAYSHIVKAIVNLVGLFKVTLYRLLLQVLCHSLSAVPMSLPCAFPLKCDGRFLVLM